MSISDFFDALKDLKKEIGDSMDELKDLTDELGEIIVGGAVATVTGDKDYKTSFEIQNEAKCIIYRSEEKYREAGEAFNSYLEELNKAMDSLYEQKIRLAKIFDRSISGNNSLPAYKREIASPEFNYKRPEYSFDIMSVRSLNDEFSPIFQKYNGLLSMMARKDAAKEYLEKAKDFEVSISGEIAEINRTKVFLESIKMNMDEEQKLITALNAAVNSGKKIKRDETAEQLHILIAEYILDSDGQVNTRYEKAVERLRKLIM